jgi:hypothetical protein
VASLGFFAGPADAADVLAFAIDELGCSVYDAHSPLDQRARQFNDVAALNEAFPRGLVADSLEAVVMLTLWAPSTAGAPVVERIALKLKGHSFREIVSGWGAMRLNLGVLDRDARTLTSSVFLHNSEKRALAWEDTSGDKLGPGERMGLGRAGARLPEDALPPSPASGRRKVGLGCRPA